MLSSSIVLCLCFYVQYLLIFPVILHTLQNISIIFSAFLHLTLQFCLNFLHSGNGRSRRCKRSGVEETQVRFAAYWPCGHWASYLSWASLSSSKKWEWTIVRVIPGAHDLVYAKCRVVVIAQLIIPCLLFTTFIFIGNKTTINICHKYAPILRPLSFFVCLLCDICFEMFSLSSPTSFPSHFPAQCMCIWNIYMHTCRLSERQCGMSPPIAT